MTTAIRATVSRCHPRSRSCPLALIVATAWLGIVAAGTAGAEETPYQLRETTVFLLDRGALHRVVDGKTVEDAVLEIKPDPQQLQSLLEFSNTGDEKPGMDWRVLGIAPPGAKPGANGPQQALRVGIPPQVPAGGRTLRLGEAGAAEADLIVNTSAKPIRANEPGTVEFGLKGGGELAPGVYRFDVLVRLMLKALKPEGHIDCAYPVEVYVPGRVLESVSLHKLGSDAPETSLRVGDASRLDVRVLCIGPQRDRGKGTLFIEQTSIEGRAKTLFKSPLPLLEDAAPEATADATTDRPAIVVPAYDGRFPASFSGDLPDEEVEGASKENAQGEGGEAGGAEGAFWCDKEWRESALVGTLSQSPVKPSGSVALSQPDWAQQHAVQVRLPDASTLGEWTAKVEWEAGSPGGAALSPITPLPTIKIQPGVRITPRVCLVKEPVVRIKAVVDHNLGETLTVEVTFPPGADGTSEKKSVTLKRKESGKSWLYSGELKAPAVIGTYSVSVIPSDDESLPSGLTNPTTFQVCFSVSTASKGNLVVFGSPIPLDVWFSREWLKSRGSGSSWVETRRNAFGIKFDDGQLSEASVRQLPLFRRTSTGWRLVDEQDEELDEFVSIRPQEAPVDEFRSGSAPGKDPRWTERELTARKWLRWNATASLTPDALSAESDDQIVRPTTDQQREIPERRKQPGVKEYEQRLLLVGVDARGERYVRIWKYPLKVQRDNQWEHHKWLFGFGGLLAVAVAVPGFFVVRNRLAAWRNWSINAGAKTANSIGTASKSTGNSFDAEPPKPKKAPEPKSTPGSSPPKASGKSSAPTSKSPAPLPNGDSRKSKPPPPPPDRKNEFF